MKILRFTFTIFVLFIIHVMERKNIKEKKDKIVFLLLVVIGGVLAGLVIFFPNIPGPNQWIETVFKPFIKS